MKIYRNKKLKDEGFPEAISMDDVEDGTTYGKVNRKYVDDEGNINASSILLSGINGTLDDIENGANFGKVALTAISAGKIVLTGGGGVTGSLPVGNTDADVTADNAQDYSWVTGTKPPTNADNTASNPQNVAWLTDAGAMAYEDMVEKAKLGSTIISGGYIKTELLTADNIVTGILTAVTVRTNAATYPKAVMNSSGFTVHGEQIIIRDESGTLEGYIGGHSSYGIYLNAANYKNVTINAPYGNVKLSGWYGNSIIYDGFSLAPEIGGGNDDLGLSEYKWRHLHLSGNIYVSGTVDGVNVSSHAASVSAHHNKYSNGYAITPLSVYTSEITVTSCIKLGSSDPIYWNGTTYYLKHDGNVFKINDDLQPNADGSKRLGYTNMAWYAVHADNYLGCALPTSNSGIGVFRKIKKPKIRKGKAYHSGKRHYFDIDEFPDEMKMTDKDSGEKDIELTRTIGVTVSAVRELVERFDEIDNRLKILETNKKQ